MILKNDLKKVGKNVLITENIGSNRLKISIAKRTDVL
jgi:hypothetical protein